MKTLKGGMKSQQMRLDLMCKRLHIFFMVKVAFTQLVSLRILK